MRIYKSRQRFVVAKDEEQDLDYIISLLPGNVPKMFLAPMAKDILVKRAREFSRRPIDPAVLDPVSIQPEQKNMLRSLLLGARGGTVS